MSTNTQVAQADSFPQQISLLSSHLSMPVFLSRGFLRPPSRSCKVTGGWQGKTRQRVYEQDPCLRHLVIPWSSCHPNHLIIHLHRHHPLCMASSNRSRALCIGWWCWPQWWQWWWRQRWCKKEQCASHLSATLYRMAESNQLIHFASIHIFILWWVLLF